jgi:hypothetical protein
MIPETRYRGVVIPIINGKYVVSEFKEPGKKTNLTFMGGGCGRKNGTIRNCALRELREESRGAIKLNLNKLVSKLKPFAGVRLAQHKMQNGNKQVTMMYHVFLAPLNKGTNIKNLQRMFNNAIPRTKNEKEMRGLQLRSHNNLVGGNELWTANKVILNKLLKGPRVRANSNNLLPWSRSPMNARWNRSRPQTARPPNRYVPPGTRSNTKTPSGSWRK